MRERWKEMSLYRRVLLVVLAAAIVGFGAATLLIGTQKGIEYQGVFLRFTEKDSVRRYTGRLDGETVQFTVTSDRTVDCRWGDETYGPYQVADDPAASPPEDGEYYHGPMLPGIEIRQGDEVLFRGGYHKDTRFWLVQENGELVEMMGFLFGTSSGKTYDADGRELTPRDLHEPSLTAVAKLALGELELTHQGSFGLYLLVTLLAAFNIFQICCPGFMFRLSLLGHVREPAAAEPSDWYIAMEHIEWAVLTGVTAWLYWLALTVIN